MEGPNPYAAPASVVADAPVAGADAALERIAAGQRHIIYAILVYIAAIMAPALAPLLGSWIGAASALLMVLAFVMSLVGLLRLAGALGKSVLSRILMVVGLMLPLIGLLILLAINGEATRRLRAGGYVVGLMGARRA
jgi:hypothetical protein